MLGIFSEEVVNFILWMTIPIIIYALIVLGYLMYTIIKEYKEKKTARFLDDFNDLNRNT